MRLFEPELHEPLKKIHWSVDAAKETIHAIVQSAINAFQQHDLWPVHPDLQATYHTQKPLTGLWMGAAGSIWAIARLQQFNPTIPHYDFRAFMPSLRAKQAESLSELNKQFPCDIKSPGYLLGYTGIDLVHWQLTQNPAILKTLATEIKNNIENPANELMWAAPGTMLTAWFLYQKTAEQRWAKLFQDSAEYLFATWRYHSEKQLHIWGQDMYGAKWEFLGLVHGFAGNVAVLLQGFDLLNKNQQQQLIERAQHTFLQTAQINETHANWKPCLGEAWPGGDKFFLQLCHGAPSMVIGLAKLWPSMNNQAKEIFLKAATLIWDAGPLKKPWGLCHGTAGNGYAFLKSYQLTGDSIWLSRARAFAMHAIDQSQAMTQQYGCIRPDNWCGDLGLALYLQDCIDERADFPLLDCI
jgi:hypothetical protein